MATQMFTVKFSHYGCLQISANDAGKEKVPEYIPATKRV